jgi:hypothetical protein
VSKKNLGIDSWWDDPWFPGKAEKLTFLKKIPDFKGTIREKFPPIGRPLFCKREFFGNNISELSSRFGLSILSDGENSESNALGHVWALVFSLLFQGLDKNSNQQPDCPIV